MKRWGLAVRPSLGPVLQPAEQELAGEVVEWSYATGDHEPPVADVDVVELQRPDGAQAGGMDGGQGHDEPGRRARGGGDRVGDVGWAQRLDNATVTLANLDAAGGVAEDRAVLLAGGEQRPKTDEGDAAPWPLQGGEDGEHVVAGDLAQVVVAARPHHQRRADAVEIVPARGPIAGTGARPTVVQHPLPGLDLTADAGGQAVELALQPVLEGGAPVIDQTSTPISSSTSATRSAPMSRARSTGNISE